MNPVYMTPRQVAQVTGMALPTLAKWRCLGGGPPFTKMGAAVRYAVADVEAWLAANGNAVAIADALRPPDPHARMREEQTERQQAQQHGAVLEAIAAHQQALKAALRAMETVTREIAKSGEVLAAALAAIGPPPSASVGRVPRAPKRRVGAQQLYVMRSMGQLKVGVSADPEARAASLRTARPDVVLLQVVFGPSARSMEQAIHEQWRQQELDVAGEWCSDTKQARDIIQSVVAGGDS